MSSSAVVLRMLLLVAGLLALTAGELKSARKPRFYFCTYTCAHDAVCLLRPLVPLRSLTRRRVSIHRTVHRYDEKTQLLHACANGSSDNHACIILVLCLSSLPTCACLTGMPHGADSTPQHMRHKVHVQ